MARCCESWISASPTRRKRRDEMPRQGKPQGVSAWTSIRAAAAGSLFSWILIKSQFFADCADKTNWPKDGPGLCTLSNPPWFGGGFYAQCSI
jgi:hypothetical protein